MATLRANVVANFMGQAWIAAMSILFMPLYLRILGVEAFGLIGVMLGFQALFQLLDFGIGGAVNREISRYSHRSGDADALRRLVYSSEIVIWAVGAFAAMMLWLLRYPLALHWLHPQGITPEAAAHALGLIGFALFMQWPSIFYGNCLSGMEKQVQSNGLQILFASLRFAGVLPVLWWVSPTLNTFLLWHALIGVCQSVITGLLVWRSLPSSGLPRQFSIGALRSSFSFAAGIFLTGVLAVAFSQIGRMLLPALRPLSETGYYVLALSAASGLSRLTQPVFNALYPRFSRQSIENHPDMIPLYHASSQLVACIVGACFSIMLFFGYDLLRIWTGDIKIASLVTPAFLVLTIGTALNGLLNVPYALQLAHGWTGLSARMNAISLMLGIPLALWAIPRWGIVGAALPWLVGNMIGLICGVPLMHQRLLNDQGKNWLLRDTLPPIMCALITAGALHATRIPTDRWHALAWLIGAGLITLFSSVLSARALRQALTLFLRRSCGLGVSLP